MNSKYIVRQPIKDAENRIIGYEIQYYGENQAFSGGDGPGASDFAAADTIYNFLTLNTDKLLRGSLNFMTFTTTLLMKKTPRLFDKSELVIQIDDSVIIHPLGTRRKGTRSRSMSFNLRRGIWGFWMASTTSS